jgi:hypothetical protein
MQRDEALHEHNNGTDAEGPDGEHDTGTGPGDLGTSFVQRLYALIQGSDPEIIRFTPDGSAFEVSSLATASIMPGHLNS